jgi:hypothetical protein
MSLRWNAVDRRRTGGWEKARHGILPMQERLLVSTSTPYEQLYLNIVML